MPIASVADLIRTHEGKRLKVYDDATGDPIRKGSHVSGYPTIGFGRNLQHRGITEGEATQLLEADIDRVRTEAQTLAWFADLNEPRQAAVMDMIYNLGFAGFVRFRRTIGHLKAGRFNEASVEMLSSKWADQVGFRALRLAEVIRSGQWPVA